VVWREDYFSFKDWALANGYRPGLTIDRINNSKGYSPSNCRFVTLSENLQNRRHPRFWRKREKVGNKR
jgi:hypothetical protein